ncbi:ABC transporter ATP-binding protein [Tumebacillus flagellatus]|nr:ABC transporter ATP-binding protein [Tumebacillus flagellatus]
MKFVIEEVSLMIRRGEVLGLVGESGSGKSLICAALLGLLPPAADVQAGQVLLESIDLLRLPPKRLRQIRGAQIAFIPQNPMTACNPSLTIGQHFLETLRAHGNSGSKRERLECAVAILEQVGLPRAGQIVGLYPFELSGGMLQRVLIALAAVLQPKVLVADEPTTALDPDNQELVLSCLRNLCAEHKMGMLLVSHDLHLLSRCARQTAVLHTGRIVESGLLCDVMRDPQHAFTRALVNAAVSKV